jgi:TatD DNase family protein
MRLIDSHAHLDARRFNKDREAVIARAREVGLVAVVTIGASLAGSQAAVALAEKHDFVYATVGVHPHDAKSVTPTVLKGLRETARHPKVVAIGEIGLDYYRDLSPRSIQRRAFVDQLNLATELGLPVVVHSREAYDDVLDALDGWSGDGVIHSYSGGPERLEETLALGFSISIAGPVTYPKAHRLREVAATVPLDRLLIETDCPYLTPQRYRGRRNEPTYVEYVAKEIARVRGASEKAIAQATTDNACRLFKIPQTERRS